MKLRYKGTTNYHGYDDGDNNLKVVRVKSTKQGLIVEVSQHKATQLMRDYPTDWEVVGEKK